MGKRKSARKPGAGKVKAKPLDKTFRCLFCGHQGKVVCKMDKPNRVGRLDCSDCGQTFQASITTLDEPVDLYSMWIDACDAVNAPAPTATRHPRPPARPAANEDADADNDENLPDLPRQRNGATLSRRRDKEAVDIGNDDDDGDDDGVDLPQVEANSAKAPAAKSAMRSKLADLASGRGGVDSTPKSTVVEDQDEDDDDDDD